MLFKKSSPPAARFRVISKAVERAEEILALGLPAKRVYSEQEVIAFDGLHGMSGVRVVDCLCEAGVLELQIVFRDEETGYLASDLIEIADDNISTDRRYRVVGSLMSLIDNLKKTAGAQPYFISYVVAEAASEAQALHSALQSAGIPGFLSSDIQTGAQWKKDIIAGLKSARTGFIFESPSYHTRERCIVERDYLVANGVRLMRIGLCDRSALNGVPSWLNDHVQHDTFVTKAGFQLNQKLLGQSLPDQLSLGVRARGGLELTSKLTRNSVDALAQRLGLLDELQDSRLSKATALCDLVFGSSVRADRFCQEIEVESIF